MFPQGCSYEMNAAGMMTVNVDGREVVITCIHVGVDLPRVDEVFKVDTMAADIRQWRQKFPNKIIVAGMMVCLLFKETNFLFVFFFAGIDRLERLKGIPLKLLAIDQFLEENEKWFGKIIFAMIGTRHIMRMI